MRENKKEVKESKRRRKGKRAMEGKKKEGAENFCKR